MSDVSVYPNPVNNILYIENASGMITIYNTIGNKVYEEEINSDNTEIDLSLYNSGIYLLVIKNENQLFKQPIIKE